MPAEPPPQRGVPRPLSGGPIPFGPFWLEARIAVGGTAEVYLARPRDTRAGPRRIIVKRLLPHFVHDPEGRTMFEREASLHASVHHENVVTVFGSGHAENGEPYLAMEYVEGVDLYRLLRRRMQDGERLRPYIACYVACEVLRGLESVHHARDAAGAPLGIIHRDVTPSNLYLSTQGEVKLGDFGIARSTGRATLRNAASAMLKGKFAYLAPEQVAGEPFDHRADLFSMAVVLAEMLLGKPLFAGGGQLAVLLAIRDCRIDALREIHDRLPPGLFEALVRALDRDPAARFPSAEALAAALRPFVPNPNAARSELAALVRWMLSTPSAFETPASSLDSEGALEAAAPSDLADADSQRVTGEYSHVPSYAVTADGARFGPWTFARLVEALATGQIGRGDSVDYMGQGLRPVEEIEEVARFLPARSVTTNKITGVGAPDFFDNVSTMALLTVLLRVLEQDETGVLFAEQGKERKEIYFRGGKLHHVASSNATELLGEYLVRRHMISREELDFALAVLPRYGGRMGDTLISLGLVNAVDIFRTIKDQGRDRLTDLFSWRQGTLSYYVGQTAPHVEFPLDLELPGLMLAGLEAAQPGDAPLGAFRPYLEARVAQAQEISARLLSIAWPSPIGEVLELTLEPRPLREILATLARPSGPSPSDVLRALQIGLAAKLVAWA